MWFAFDLWFNLVGFLFKIDVWIQQIDEGPFSMYSIRDAVEKWLHEKNKSIY